MLLFCCKQYYTSLDESVRLEILLCSWKRFYASLDRSVWVDWLLCSWKQFCASLDGSVQLEMLLCTWKWFYASFDGSVMCRFVDFEVPLGCKQTRKNCVDDHASSTPARTRAKISFANSRLTWKGWRLKCRSWIKKPRKTSLLTSQHWRKTGTG